MIDFVRALTFILVLGIFGPEQSDQTDKVSVAVTPANPTELDRISAVLSGTWPDACVPESAKLVLSGQAVHLDLVVPDNICAQVLTKWALSVPVGQLLPGNYSVEVRHTTRLLGTTAFRVVPAARE